MDPLYIPENYHADLNLHDTQIAIKMVKDFFSADSGAEAESARVSAPVFVDPCPVLMIT